MEARPMLRCMFCDHSLSHRYPDELLFEARRYGWHDINPVAPGGDEAAITHHGTCPGCIWEHSARGQAVS